MEYSNIILFILIFIILLVIFYLVISNFGVMSSNPTNNTWKNTDQDIEKKVNILKKELSSLKNTLGIDLAATKTKFSNYNTAPLSGDNNSVREIIIDTGVPTINTSDSDGLVYNDIQIGKNNSTNPINPTCSDNVCTKPPPVIYDPIANYDIAKLTDPLVDPRGRTSADQIPTPQVAAQFNFPTQGVLDRYHRVGLLIAIGSGVKNENAEKINRFGLPYSESDNSDDSDLEFVWEGNNKMGKSKKSKSKKNKKYNNYGTGTVEAKAYKGVDIKENFESDSDYDYDYSSDGDSMEYFGNTDKNVTNIYNVYSNQNDNNILELIGKKVTDNWYKYFTSITMGNKVIKVVVRNRNRKELYSGDIVFIPEIGKTYRVKIDPMDMIEYNPYFF